MRTLVYLPFQPSAQGLLCDGVSMQSIVERVGTPAYVYSAHAIRHAYQAIDSAFAGYPHAEIGRASCRERVYGPV